MSNVTVIINCKKFLKPLYEYCLREQLSTYSYNTHDRVHINLTKHYIILDTLMRMLQHYNEMLAELNANNVLLLFDQKKIPKIEPLPLSTLITETTPVPMSTSKEAIFQQISLTLKQFNTRLRSDDIAMFKDLETFIHKYGVFEKTYDGIMKVGVTSSKFLSLKTYERRLEDCQKQISEQLLPIFMRLTADEITSCLKLFVQIVANNSTQHNVKVIKFTANKHSPHDSYLAAYKKFKHSLKIIFAHDHSTIHSNLKLIASHDCDNCTYNFNNIVINKPITNNLNTYVQFNLHKHFTYKYTSRYIVPNRKATPASFETITFKPLYLCTYLNKLDTKYCNVIPYINPCALAAMNDFYMVYTAKTYKSLQTDVFEDVDLAFCHYSDLKQHLYNIIWKFNSEYPFRILLDQHCT